jgi:hypothetical protein
VLAIEAIIRIGLTVNAPSGRLVRNALSLMASRATMAALAALSVGASGAAAALHGAMMRIMMVCGNGTRTPQPVQTCEDARR